MLLLKETVRQWNIMPPLEGIKSFFSSRLFFDPWHLCGGGLLLIVELVFRGVSWTHWRPPFFRHRSNLEVELREGFPQLISYFDAVDCCFSLMTICEQMCKIRARNPNLEFKSLPPLFSRQQRPDEQSGLVRWAGRGRVDLRGPHIREEKWAWFFCLFVFVETRKLRRRSRKIGIASMQDRKRGA